MKTQHILLILVIVAVGVYTWTHSSALAGIPSTVTLKVVDTSGNPVSGAICYVNQAGRSDCPNPYANTTICQIKDSSDGSGICDFNGETAFNSGFSYQVAIVCPASLNYIKVQSSYNPYPGISITKEMICKARGNATNSSEMIPETPVSAELGQPICVMQVYKDEYCGDFNFGQKTYSFLRDGVNRKLCWTQPGWAFGDCYSGETPVGDTCASTPSYVTPESCASGFIEEGDYCVVYAQSESPSVQCDVDQTLQTVNGVNVCVSQPQPKETVYVDVYKYLGYFGSENTAILAGVLVSLLCFIGLRKLKII